VIEDLEQAHDIEGVALEEPRLHDAVDDVLRDGRIRQRSGRPAGLDARHNAIALDLRLLQEETGTGADLQQAVSRNAVTSETP
jgi:hypothetical protein